jgi:hypothetical protein
VTNYDAKSCSALEKPYYRPIEAALRWCGLTKHEPEIIGAMSSGELTPPFNRFPQWPCLYLNTEKIVDAIRHSELPGGRDGVTVVDPSGVAKHRLTIRHSDLKKWMAATEPGKTPAFLFGEAGLPDELHTANIAEKPLGTIERNTLLAIIAVLCKEAGYDPSKHAKTAGLIQGTAAGMGLSIGETTIEDHLKKIPNALATRMK